MKSSTARVLLPLALLALVPSAMAQSHIQLIEQTPCLYEFRVWYLTFRRPEPFPVPGDFTPDQCAVAARVHERIQNEQADAEKIPDPSPGPKDEDERAIACLHEYRLWKAIDKGATSFNDALNSFAPFKVHGADQCAEARAAEAKISVANASHAARAKAEAERLRQETARSQATLARKEAADRAAREAMARRPGVRIGMTQQDVLERSNWGPPQSRRRTTTAEGVREQWIYEGSNYLYFENGKLVAIQD
jgi:hypothetical protein